jgi:hypothetical protein
VFSAQPILAEIETSSYAWLNAQASLQCDVSGHKKGE